nr:hypothetical protein CFP56_00902 [Quercus suber]
MDPDFPITQPLEGLVHTCPSLEDHALDKNDLEHTCPLDIGRHRTDPQHDLGVLDQIPLETLNAVLVRRVSQRAMQVINSLPQFRTIIRHGISSLRGILSVEAGSRVCFLCCSEQTRYLPLSSAEVSRSFGLGRKLLTSLRKMRSVPGCYSPNENSCRTRLVLTDPESARRAGIAFHGSALAIEQHVTRAASMKMEVYCAKVARKARGVPGPTPRQPPSMSVRANPNVALAKRCMAIVCAPSLFSPIASSAEWGFHCVGCQRLSRSRPLHWRRKYTVDTFDDHILQCGPIVDDKHCSPDDKPLNQ